MRTVAHELSRRHESKISKSSKMRLFCCSLLFLAGLIALCQETAQPPAAQSVPEMTSHDSAPTFSSKVNLVLVPVVVRDRNGKAVGNLTKDDFRVFDKSKPQVVARFSVESNAAAAADVKTVTAPQPAEGAEPVSPHPETPERYVAYIFDDLNTKSSDLMRVQQAAKKHLHSICSQPTAPPSSQPQAR